MEQQLPEFVGEMADEIERVRQERKDRHHDLVEGAIKAIDDHAFAMIDRDIPFACNLDEIEAIIIHNVEMLRKLGADEELWKIYLINIGSQIVRCIAAIEANRQKKGNG